jgi:glycosyltransferase involved in cell wall biosynthesis
LEAVDLLVAAPGPVASYAESLGARAQVVELARAHRLVHAYRVFQGSRSVFKLARNIEADVLYANGTRAIPYAVGAAVLGARPLLFHHHGLLARGPVRTLVRAAGRWADAIVVPSHTGAAPFRSAAEKVHVVPNGLDVARFHRTDDGARAKLALGVPADAIVVGTLTRSDPAKGMSEFLDMTERVTGSLPNVHFVVAGGPVFPHEDEPYHRVVERARMLGSRVTLTGRIDDAMALYSAADIFVHLGRPEGRVRLGRDPRSVRRPCRAGSGRRHQRGGACSHQPRRRAFLARRCRGARARSRRATVRHRSNRRTAARSYRVARASRLNQ